MGTLLNIRTALESRLNTMVGLPEVVWPNTKVDDMPVKGTAYFRVHHIPADTVLVELNGKDKYQGFMQISIRVPLNQGAATLIDYMDDIKNHFNKQTLTAGGDTIFVREVIPGPDNREEAWHSGYVQINYICYSE